MTVSLPTRSAGPAVVTPAAELDFTTVPRLRDELNQLIESDCARVVVDLRGVACLDEHTLGVLVGTWRRLRARRGELRVVCAPGRVFDRLRIAGLTRVLAIYWSLESALADPRRAG